MTQEPMIRLRDVTKVYPGTDAAAVSGLSLDVPRGELVVLVGPSGCGKTTTLKMINRLIEPSSGTITVGGKDVTTLPPHELRRGIGYVIQQIGLFPHRTIRDNIATVPRLLGWEAGDVRARVEELVHLVDLESDLLDRYPAELSGGQRQRVGVARALAADPPVLLMDEPFGAVDPIVRARLQSELLEIQGRLGKTIVFVTHDIDEGVRLGDRIAILRVGGVLAQYGPPAEILRDPADAFVAGFLGTDRGLKRLALISIADVDLDPGPVVAPNSDVEAARRMMERYRTDWVAVGENDHIHGWVGASDLDGKARVPDSQLRAFRTRLTPGSTLKEALDAVVSDHTSVAAVFDGDRYLGMLTAETIGREISE